MLANNIFLIDMVLGLSGHRALHCGLRLAASQGDGSS